MKTESLKSKPVLMGGVALLSIIVLFVLGWLIYKAIWGQNDEFLHLGDGKTGIEEAVSASKLTRVDGNEVIIFGKISTLNETVGTFDLIDEQYSIRVYYQGNEGYEDLDMADVTKDTYVVIKGVYSDIKYGVIAKEVNVVSAEDVIQAKNDEKPILEIEIVNTPKNVEHACKQFDVDVAVKNTGKTAISHEEIYSNMSKRKFYFVVNEADLDNTNYYVLAEDGDDPYKIGLGNFGTLQPGESKNVKFYGGGMVTQSVNKAGRPQGISGEHNILSPNLQHGGQPNENTLTLVWGSTVDEEGNHIGAGPLVIKQSKTVKIDLINEECDIEDIQNIETLDW